MQTDRWPLALCAGIFAASSLALALGPRVPRSSDLVTAGTSRQANLFRSRAVPTSAEDIAAVAEDPTDQALAEYALAAKRLESGELEQALPLLDTARDRPLVIRSASPRDDGGAAPDDISAASQLLLVSTNLCRAAGRAAEKGDAKKALAWLQRSRDVALQALETEQPTLEALLTARSIDAKTGRAEVQALRTLKRTDEVRRVERREAALKRFYSEHVMPEVIQARDANEAVYARYPVRDRNVRERGAALARLEEANDLLSGGLIRSYLAERTQLLLT